MTSPAARRFPVRKFLLLFLVLTALAASLAEAFFINQPGSMDACYYYDGGSAIVRDGGRTEQFLWNYLDSSGQLPHPAFQYWMPLPSVVAAIGMLLFREGFRQAQIPFLLLSIAFPWFVFWLGMRLTGSFRTAILAGFFAVFSGFYTIYWMNTESFLLYAWIGGLIIGLSDLLKGNSRRSVIFLIGICCGLAHLTRADGVLFVALAGWLLGRDSDSAWRSRLGQILVFGSGYLLTSGLWFLRNGIAFGQLFPPGTEKAMWLTEYNDLFHFPSSEITAERFFSSGISSILSVRWNAFQGNVQTTVLVVGLIFLFPLVGWGLYLLRNKVQIRTAVLYFLMLFFLMTFVYPLQGSRGGFMHSSTAILSIAAIAASVGLDDAIARLSRWRNWNTASAQAVLGAGIAFLALCASGAIFYIRVIGSTPAATVWSKLNVEYSNGIHRLGETLPPSTRFIVNNPPCFFLQTGYQAVPVPVGTPAMLLDAIDIYDIQYVILDSNVPEGLLPLYQGEVTLPRLKEAFSEEYDGMKYLWLEVLPP